MPRSTSIVPRKIMLVPLPLVLQRSLKFASDVLPTFTLLSFVFIQFILNLLRYIPARYWQSWVDRFRLVLKVLLDSDYRRDRHQLDILHQRIVDLERHNTTLTQNVEDSNEQQRLLRERLVSQTHKGDEDWQTRCREAESLAQHHETELARIKRQFDAQSQLLEETEGLLTTLRTSNDEARLSRLGNGDGQAEKREILAQVDALRESEGALTARVTDLTAKLETAEASVSLLTAQVDDSNTKLRDAQRALEAVNTTLQDLRAQSEQEVTSAHNETAAQKDTIQSQLHEAITAREQAEQAYEAAVTAHDETVQSLVKVNEETEKSLQAAQKSREDAENQLFQLRQELTAAQARTYNAQLVNTQLQGKIKAMEEREASQSGELKSETEQVQVMEDAHAKIVQLENSVAEKTRDNEALTADVKAKDEEISRLNELLEQADNRAHKLKKPRRPSTSVPHNQADGSPEPARTGSISSRLGLDRFGSERQRTVSGSSTQAFPPAMAYEVGSVGRTSGRSRRGSVGAGSPSMSPAHRAQASLPNDHTVPETSGPTSISFVVEEFPRDKSTSASPEKHSSKRSSGSTRRRLSSILGLHDKHDKEKHTKEAS